MRRAVMQFLPPQSWRPAGWMLLLAGGVAAMLLCPLPMPAKAGDTDSPKLAPTAAANSARSRAEQFARGLVVSLNRASLEVVSAKDAQVGVEAFQIAGNLVVREKTELDCQAWLEHETFYLKLGSQVRPHMVYRLHVPGHIPLHVEASAGHIKVADREGSVHVFTGSGGVHLGKIKGEVEVRAHAGDISLERGAAAVDMRAFGGQMMVGEIAGPATLSTSGGSIYVWEIKKGAIAKSSGGSVTIGRAEGTLHAESGGGSVTVHFASPPVGDNLFSAAGGDVLVGLPPHSNCRIAARGDGDVDTDLPIEWKDQREGFRRGVLNTLGATLTLRSEGGPVHINGFFGKAIHEGDPVLVKSALPALPSPGAIFKPVATDQKPESDEDSWQRVYKPDAPLLVEREETVWNNADWKPVKMQAAGVLLRAGGWVEGQITSLNTMQVKYRQPGRDEQSASLSRIRAVLFTAIPDSRLASLEPGRRGVLLSNGEFLECEVKKLERDHLIVDSTLFGLKKYALKTEVVAMVP